MLKFLDKVFLPRAIIDILIDILVPRPAPQPVPIPVKKGDRR